MGINMRLLILCYKKNRYFYDINEYQTNKYFTYKVKKNIIRLSTS